MTAHVVIHIDEHGGLIVEPGEVRIRAAAGESLGALGNGVTHLGRDLFELLLGCHAPKLDLLVARSLPKRLHFLHDLIDKDLVDRLLYIDPFNGCTYLTGIHQGSPNARVTCPLKVSVLQDDQRVFAAEFEGHRNETVGGPAHYLFPDLYAASKGDHVDKIDQRLTGLCSTYDDLQ